MSFFSIATSVAICIMFFVIGVRLDLLLISPNIPLSRDHLQMAYTLSVGILAIAAIRSLLFR